MNYGDIVVCGVTQDEVVDDIARPVPKGVPVAIPGDLAHRSKDLWVLLSQGRIFQLNINSLLRKKLDRSTPEDIHTELQVAKSESLALSEELSKVRASISELELELESRSQRISTLESELGRLENELALLRRASADSSKLDDIISLLKSRPVQQVVMAPSSTYQAASKDDDIPMYIPSQIKSDSAGGQVSVKEGSADASSLADASKALKGLRKKS